jgi:hypothetical protein
VVLVHKSIQSDVLFFERRARRHAHHVDGHYFSQATKSMGRAWKIRRCFELFWTPREIWHRPTTWKAVTVGQFFARGSVGRLPLDLGHPLPQAGGFLTLTVLLRFRSIRQFQVYGLLEVKDSQIPQVAQVARYFGTNIELAKCFAGERDAGVQIQLDGFAPASRWEEPSLVVPRRNSDDQWVSDAIRRIRRARWLPHGLKQKRVDHPV